ncbi:MAG TPA: hypothetical protein VEP73_03220 [Actinomycetota bacterium]|nr:hypothetical protein [Actinomycetota bacterium]
MGRRARARERAVAPATEATAVGRGLASRAADGRAAAGTSRGRRVLGILNPLKATSRRRMAWAAVVFAVLGLALVVAGVATGRPEWYRPALLLGLLAVVWGARAALTAEAERRPASRRP